MNYLELLYDWLTGSSLRIILSSVIGAIILSAVASLIGNLYT